MDTFDLQPHKTGLLLYGAGTNGIHTKQELEKRGFRILGFLDMRAQELGSLDGLPVWLPAPDRLPAFPEEPVVLITVKNVFEHQRIVKLLLRCGLRQLLYKPYAVLAGEGSEAQQAVSAAFDEMITGKSTPSAKIPCSSKAADRQERKGGLFEEQGGKGVFYAPLPFIFTNQVKREQFAWADLNCAALWPHIELFRFFGGLKGDYRPYLDFCIGAAERSDHYRVTEEWKRNIIRNRYEVFRHMEYFHDADPDFFVRSAPEACWNPKGYFNLTGGKHRVTYLISKGHFLIPIRVSKEDYEKFLDRDQAERLARKLEEEGGEEAVMTLHPYFYQETGAKQGFYQTLLTRSTELLAKALYQKDGLVDFSRLTVLDGLSCAGLCAAHFYRMGCRTCRLEGSTDSLEQELDRLNGAGNIPLLADCPPEADFDLAFIEGKDAPTVLNSPHRFSWLFILRRGMEEERNIPEGYRFAGPVCGGIMTDQICRFDLYRRA